MQIHNMKFKRSFYVTAAMVLLVVEIFIALYIHDKVIRPYIGDLLVVIVIYCFVRIWIPEGKSLLPLYIFLFATGVEILQYLNLVTILGLEHNLFFRTILGSVFDVKDIFCYGIGCILLQLFQKFGHLSS